jgi:hypothetical protein
MFHDYTIEELLELRCLCLENIERINDTAERADTLLVLECIEQELSRRQSSKAA